MDIAQLPTAACKTYLFQNLNSSLLSIGQLCDAGCIALFDKKEVTILFKNEVILQGERDVSSGMWNVELAQNNDGNQPLPGPNIIQHAAMSAIAAETLGERIAFLHACAGSPAISTFRKSYPCRFLHNLARTHSRQSQQIPRHASRHDQRTPRPTKKKHSLNQTKSQA